jgi:hypothetical protein
VAEAETPLSGGTLNSVVRVGTTVRRTAGPWTPTVQSLLRHLRDRDFDLAPEPLGLDRSGRETVSYIPGTTVGWSLPWPDVVRADALLEEMGAVTARYHRAVADFRPAGTRPWQSAAAELGPNELVCHHDLAPYNVVLAGERIGGIIDWDLAGPGTALSELAFVAWQWVPLHGPFVTRLVGWQQPPDRVRRLRLLLDAYGLDDRADFINLVVDRIGYNRLVMVRQAAQGHPAYQRLIDQGHLAGMDEALTFLAAHGTSLQDGL